MNEKPLEAKELEVNATYIAEFPDGTEIIGSVKRVWYYAYMYSGLVFEETNSKKAHELTDVALRGPVYVSYR